MTRIAILLTLAACKVVEPAPVPCGRVAPDIVSIQLVDPSTLTCETFGDTCDPGSCAPCPETGATPDWGRCDSACQGLDEAACSADTSCRLARNANDHAFLGCFPLDAAPPQTQVCVGEDADNCARDPRCTGLYDVDAPGSFTFRRCEDASSK
jgi:hypothetical protein